MDKLSSIFIDTLLKYFEYQKRFFVIALFLYSVNLSAQSLSDTLALNVIEVSATPNATFINEVPASVNILKKKDIQELNQTTSIDEALRQIPGLFVNNRYNFSQGERISIRGLGSRAQFGIRSIKVLLDGIPMTFPDGTTQLNNLDLSSIGRIEILRGPASSLYGNAAGGVIAFYTENPPLDYNLLAPRIIIGSDGLFKLNTKFTTASDNTQFIINTSATDYDGYRDFSNARLYNLNSVFKWFPNESTAINFIINAMHAPYMYNPGGVTKEVLENNPREVRPIVQRQVASKEVTQAQAGVNIKKGLRFGDLNSSFFTINRWLFNPIFGRIIDIERYSLGMRNTLSKEFTINNRNSINLTLGFDHEFQTDNRQEFENIGVTDDVVKNTPIENLIDKAAKGPHLVNQREQINVTGIYTSATYELLNKLILTSSLRYDYQVFNIKNHMTPSDIGSGKVIFDQLSPSAGFVFKINSDFDYYFNFSTAFQTPTANEFSNDPSGTGFNENLLPERVKSFETGLRKSGDKLEAEVAGFYFIVQNQLIPYQISTFTDETFYRNAGRTKNTGAEFWLKFQPEPNSEIILNYTFMHYIFSDYKLETAVGEVQLKDNIVPGAPAHKIFVGIKKKFRFGLISEVELQYVDDYFTNDFNGPAPAQLGDINEYINESYFTADIKMGFEKEFNRVGFLIFGGINNIFNTSYSSSIIPNAAGNRFFEPAPGRNYYLGLEIPLKLNILGT